MAKNGKLTITQVARKLGVVPKTIMRWEKAGKIKKAKRDWRGWRVYDPQQLAEIKSFFETLH
ncbi:MAG: MerR family transcriptional regulator [Candidatus Omnitrophica bacterium]|nr:MerR family transcriptional regulator [Candidatus Omnitrophota bacterium]